MNGGDAVVETLIEHGVDTAFTVSGESFLPVLEALRRHRNTVRLVTTRHEGGAAVHERIDGAVGACTVVEPVVMCDDDV